MKRIKVIDESKSGRNIRFQDTRTKENMTRVQFVKKIKVGKYEGYHIRKINGVDTPVSKPNGKKNDNLG